MPYAEKNWGVEDIVGTNYALNEHIHDHINHPDRVLVSTESWPGNPFDMWKNMTYNSFVVGDFIWTAQDYIGESGIGHWFYADNPEETIDPPKDANDKEVRTLFQGDDRLFPWHGSIGGEIDLIGDRKPISHYRNIVWNCGEKIYIGVRQPEYGNKKVVVAGWGFYPSSASWTWPGWEGKNMVVDVYSRYTAVRLYCNGQKIGDSDTGENQQFKATFNVPYQPGVLKAVGLVNGQEVNDGFELKTAGESAKIRLTPDRNTFHADGEDVVFVHVDVLDKDGNPQPNSDQEISFTVDGPAAIAGLGNANMKSVEPYQGTQCKVFHGKALVVLRSNGQSGFVRLTAQSDGLKGAQCTVQSTSQSR
jgi:beta-galactosidase